MTTLANLAALPDEILLLILDKIPEGTSLWPISLASRNLNRVTSSRLYQHVQFTKNYSQRNAVLRFLRTVYERPDLAALTESLAVRSWPIPKQRPRLTMETLCRPVSRNVDLIHEATSILEIVMMAPDLSVFSPLERAVVPMLCVHLPRLSHLDHIGKIGNGDTFDQRLSMLGAYRLPALRKTFDRLSHLRIHAPVPHLPEVFIRELFRMPCLETLELVSMDKMGGNRLEPLLPWPSRSSRIRTLRLLDNGFSFPFLCNIFGACAALRELEYSIDKEFSWTLPSISDLDHRRRTFATILATQKPSLEMLTIEVPFYQHAFNLGFFRDFTRLRHLRGPLVSEAFRRPDVIAIWESWPEYEPEWNQVGRNLLPRSLESLVFTDIGFDPILCMIGMAGVTQKLCPGIKSVVVQRARLAYREQMEELNEVRKGFSEAGVAFSIEVSCHAFILR